MPSNHTRNSSQKQERRLQTRKIPYRVGYSWNKGGRLKELRIRHLARKFLKIWMNKTFGRILPHEARSHYNNVVLRRTFEGWKDEWWKSRREWSLNMRAECHYRYYLCNRTLHGWRNVISLRKKKRIRMQSAQSIAERHLMRVVWGRWEVFMETRRFQSKVLKSALAQKKIAAMRAALCSRSAWSLWQTRLKKQRELCMLEDQALIHRALHLQRKAWLLWKEMHTGACYQKEKETKAVLHWIITIKKRSFSQWKIYTSCHRAKKEATALAQHSYCLHLLWKCWSKWSNALDNRRKEETRLQAASHLAAVNMQRKALLCWRTYVQLCKEEAEKNQRASQHFHHSLLRAGFQGLSLNVKQNRAHRMNNNIAVQHCQQTIMSKFWTLWKDRLEEVEDRSFQPMTKMAQNSYRISLLRECFYHWREKLTEQRHNQELEQRADVWFAERMLPCCFKTWVEFTLQRRLHEHRRHRAEVFNRQRQYAWVFYTWWGKSEKHKEEMLSERMAVLHEERTRLQRAWARWWQRTQLQVKEAEKQEASHRLYHHRLLHKAVAQWKETSTEIRDRRNREQQACLHGDLRCMRLAVDKWKKFVQRQRLKKSRLMEIQRYHEVKLLKQSCVAWKKHHSQMSVISERAEELYRERTRSFLRNVLVEWREKAVLRGEVRVAEQRAQSHFEHILQLKVFLVWREATSRAVSKRHQQGEAHNRLQCAVNQMRLLNSFRLWRKQTREARRERMSMEKARRHHNSKLLAKTLTAWRKHHHQNQRNKVMKRQGMLLLKLKLYQTYFEEWRIKLQHRQREAKQAERALWHWSLTLQAKVLFGWRLWVSEQRRKREQTAKAAQTYRDQLLREGVTRILTYAVHMNDLTTGLTQLDQQQRSQTLQRVVKRCAMRWKQRVLCKPQKEQPARTQLPKKSVTFCLDEPPLDNISTGELAAPDGAFNKHILKESDLPGAEFSACRCPSHTDHPVALSYLHLAKGPATASHQHTLISADIPSEPHMSAVDLGLETPNQELLLPPSAFMTLGSTDVSGKSSGSHLGEALRVPFHQPASPFEHHSSADSEKQRRGFDGKAVDLRVEDVPADPASALAGELLSIQQDMRSFQQSRKQLRAWRKLRDVLQSWLQTSGEDEPMEKNAVCDELKELEERIHRLSTELDKRKPMMLLHTERIQLLQSLFSTSGVSSAC
ncbi:uncharacterized protein sfi1 isoform 1-T1 [Menidia menidia]